MKFYASIFLGIFLLVNTAILGQTEGVSIASTTVPPDPSAMLDVQSTIKGMLIPTMLLKDRDAILNPRHGLMVFVDDIDDTIDGFYFYDGNQGKWVSFAGESLWQANGNKVYRSTPQVGIGTSNPQFDLEVRSNSYKSLLFDGRQGQLEFTAYGNSPIESGNGGSWLLHRAKKDPIASKGSFSVAYRQILSTGQTGIQLRSFSDHSRIDSENGPLYLSSAKDQAVIFIPGILNGDAPAGFVSEDKKWHFNGDVCYAGSLNQCSDQVLKSNILPISSALSGVLASRGVSYLWKDQPEKGVQYGVIAQEVEQIFPHLVSTEELHANAKDGLQAYKTVNYTGYTGIFIEAFKEQQSYINKLEERNKQQQRQIDELSNRLDKIEMLLLEQKDETLEHGNDNKKR